MKTIFFTLLICVFCTTSCKKKADDVLSGASCNNLVIQYQEEVLSYANNPTASNCNKVKNTLTQMVNKCSILPVAQRDQYRRELDDWDCNE